MYVNSYKSQTKMMINQLGQTSRNISDLQAKITSGDSFKGRIDNPVDILKASRAEATMRGNRVAEDNLQDGIALLDVKDEALDKMEDISHRLRELSVTFQHGTHTREDKEKMKEEARSLIEELNYTKNNTTFNNKNVFSHNQFTVQAGGNSGEQLFIKPSDFNGVHIGKAADTPHNSDDTTAITTAAGEPIIEQGHSIGNDISDVVDNLCGWLGFKWFGSGGCHTGNGSGENNNNNGEVGGGNNDENHDEVTPSPPKGGGVVGESPAEESAGIESILNTDFIDNNLLGPLANDRATVAIERNRMELRLDSVAETGRQAEETLSRVRDTDIARAMVELNKQKMLAEVNSNFLARSMEEYQYQVMKLLS